MKVEHVPCGSFTNESESKSLEELKKKLQGLPGEGLWILLTNLAHSVGHNVSSDEIDIIALGASGIHIIEVKHWDSQYLKSNTTTVDHEAEKLNNKVKKVASKLRQQFDLGFIEGKMLLTKGEYKCGKGQQRQAIRGIKLFGLKEWHELLELDSPITLDTAAIKATCHYLEPRTKVPLSGDIRTFADITNLERISSESDRFHRIYKGLHSRRRDRLILHLYDLSAYDGKNPEEVSRREFDTLQRLQKSSWVPSLMDSFQDVQEYPGELYYFSIVDPASPTLSERSQDGQWSIIERLRTAALCAEALAKFHKPDAEESEPILHRNITPQSIRVRSNGKPLFTQFNLAKLNNAPTVTSATHSFEGQEVYVSPEILQSGLGAADIRSDIYALCSSLRVLFENRLESEAKSALELLEKGTASPDNRIALEELHTKLLELAGDKQPVIPSMPAAQFWDEDTEVIFQGKYYKIISKLGSGGCGTTFKVLHYDNDTKEEFGTYVGKIIHTQEVGKAALKAYSKARPYITHHNLSGIFEIASQWDENQFVALMKWVEGCPLSDLESVLEIYREDIGEESCEVLVLRWLYELCDALSAIHQVKLVHGDVSPKNIIVSGSEVTLTDYDFISDDGGKPIGRGTTTFCAPNIQSGVSITCSDDIFALAATFFYVLFEQEPFRFDDAFAKNRGLNWKGIEKDKWQKLASFLDKATNQDSNNRFSSAIEARNFLRKCRANISQTTDGEPVDSCRQQLLTPNQVPWLLNILRSYPGSRHGNAETRGLDSEFAEMTYVKTRLEQALLEEIKGRRVSLVVLCGNAGDGKTAFLQHLATRLGLPKKPVSAERIWNYTLEDGLRVRANLDGSASYKNQSATQLLDEFFNPFHSGNSPTNIVHLVAINSGKLLEWIEDYEDSNRGSPLTEQLWEALAGNENALAPHIRFIDLNVRSLVGGIALNSTEISTNFLDELIEKLLSGSDWQACQTCTAQSRCQAWNSVQSLREQTDGLGTRIKKRLYAALQAVHQRGEVHITARELRAAISYIFFGIDYCTDLHENPERIPLLYYDRTFMPISGNRQGEVLRELTYLDPALETNPLIDRDLIGQGNIDSMSSLFSRRRRTYFEWTDEKIKSVGLDEAALGLARGKHLSTFLKVATMTEEERAKVCADLCRGISKLEDLPPFILERRDVVPLKISPRTPTESAFWVEKPIERFSLFPEQFSNVEGLETLHSHLVLQYKYADVHVEKLILGTELFYILMELKNGYQFSDTLSDDTFTNLSIFTQRLAQEDNRVLYACNPIEEETAFEVKIVFEDGVQKLVLQSAESEVTA